MTLARPATTGLAALILLLAAAIATPLPVPGGLITLVALAAPAVAVVVHLDVADALARLVAAVITSATLNLLVATTMLLSGAWNPRLAVAVVALLALGLLLAPRASRYLTRATAETT